MKKKNEKRRIDWKINKTAQETIPYYKVHQKHGIIETNEKEFCRAYLLKDLNFSTSKVEDQHNMFFNYQNLLNSFPADVRIQIIIINKNIDKEEFKNQVLMGYKKDGLDSLREEFNTMLVDKIKQGKNNLVHNKYLIASLEAETPEEAIGIFRQVDNIVSSGIRKIGGANTPTTEPLKSEEHLEVLHDIYNPDLSGQFNVIKNIDGEEVKSFTFENMVKMGLNTKDLISPDSFEFKSDHFKVADKYGKVLYIHSLPSFLSPRILNELASNNANQLVSLTYSQVDQVKAIKTVERHINSLNAERVETQKRGSKGGYDGDIIAHHLVEEIDNAKEFLSDMSSRNQKLFMMTGIITVFGDSKEELERHTSTLTNIARRFLLDLKTLRFQQEQGLAQSLPLCRKDIYVERTLNTEASAIFMPFDTQEFSHENGRYYGVNATSKNLLVYDRKKAANQNGFILGVPGSGKSFLAKAEMVGVMLGTDDDIIVVDPEAEYGDLAKLIGGSIVPIALGSDSYINPLDMADDYGDGRDPIPEKSDFMIQLVETIVGNRYTGLNPTQKSILDRAVKESYKQYFEKLNKIDKNRMNHKDYIKMRRNITPTLSDFRNVLLSFHEIESQSLATALEQFTVGSFNLFSKKTNVDNEDRFIVYDISKVGKTIMPLAMLIMMDAIWNRILENRGKGRNTWVYIDEIYLMFRNEESAALLQNMWKRARKYGGINTGITQNVEDLLQSSTASTMLSNSEFVLVMNQSAIDRDNLIGLLNISENQSSYITSAEPGQGLLYTGSSIIPFVNKFPSNTELYKVMTTKVSEVDKYRSERELRR